MIKTRIALGLVAVLAVAGCSSSSSSSEPAAPSVPSASPTGPASDPCELIDRADASALKLHYPGSKTTMDFGPSCDFGAMQFTVVRPEVSSAAFTSGTTRRVSGLGQHAYYGNEFHWLRVQTAHSRFEVRCILCESAGELATLKTAAQRVLTHVT